jgi:hypothetical protein
MRWYIVLLIFGIWSSAYAYSINQDVYYFEKNLVDHFRLFKTAYNTELGNYQNFQFFNQYKNTFFNNVSKNNSERLKILKILVDMSKNLYLISGTNLGFSVAVQEKKLSIYLLRSNDREFKKIGFLLEKQAREILIGNREKAQELAIRISRCWKIMNHNNSNTTLENSNGGLVGAFLKSTMQFIESLISVVGNNIFENFLNQLGISNAMNIFYPLSNNAIQNLNLQSWSNLSSETNMIQNFNNLSGNFSISNLNFLKNIGTVPAPIY